MKHIMLILSTIPVVLIVFVVYFISLSQVGQSFLFPVTVLAVVLYGVLSMYMKRKGFSEKFVKVNTYLSLVLTLLVVAATGWYFSPFFFLLYFISVALAFMFGRMHVIVFVLALITLFALNLGEVDFVYDFLIMLSLLSVIPISFYLRKKYLYLQQAQKKILLLEEERRKYVSKLEKVLSNAVNKFALEMKEPINDIKLLSQISGKEGSPKKDMENRKKIETLAELSLKKIREFEKETTDKKFVSKI